MWFFRKMAKNVKKVQKGQVLENWAKIYKIQKYFEKGQVIACDYHAQ